MSASTEIDYLLKSIKKFKTGKIKQPHIGLPAQIRKEVFNSGGQYYEYIKKELPKTEDIMFNRSLYSGKIPQLLHLMPATQFKKNIRAIGSLMDTYETMIGFEPQEQAFVGLVITAMIHYLTVILESVTLALTKNDVSLANSIDLTTVINKTDIMSCDEIRVTFWKLVDGATNNDLMSVLRDNNVPKISPAVYKTLENSLKAALLVSSRENTFNE